MPRNSAKQLPIFLIAKEGGKYTALVKDLNSAGHKVHGYMTGREFLFDKQNHAGGIVAAEFHLLDMTAAALCDKLSDERSKYPFIIIAGHAQIPKAITTSEASIVVNPVKFSTMLNAIKQVTTGEAWEKDELEKAFGRMTERELEVIPLIAAGLSSRKIAEQLDISTKTVEAHRARIMDKARAVDAGHLARMWRAWNQLGVKKRSN